MLDKVQNLKIVAINVIVTFLEVLVATLAVSDQPLSKAAVIGAAGAAASVVWNVVIKPAAKEYTDLYKK